MNYFASAVFFVSLTARAVSLGVPSSGSIRGVTPEFVHGNLAGNADLIFVDAREGQEYTEERIPGAVNVPLRDISGNSLASVTNNRQAPIIAYCIKDFRGYEVARALKRVGYTNVHVMTDPGLRGWKKAGLPTAGTLPGVSDETALAALRKKAVAYVQAASAASPAASASAVRQP